MIFVKQGSTAMPAPPTLSSRQDWKADEEISHMWIPSLLHVSGYESIPMYVYKDNVYMYVYIYILCICTHIHTCIVDMRVCVCVQVCNIC